jgi:hypothetical protein
MARICPTKIVVSALNCGDICPMLGQECYATQAGAGALEWSHLVQQGSRADTTTPSPTTGSRVQNQVAPRLARSVNVRTYLGGANDGFTRLPARGFQTKLKEPGGGLPRD